MTDKYVRNINKLLDSSGAQERTGDSVSIISPSPTVRAKHAPLRPKGKFKRRPHAAAGPPEKENPGAAGTAAGAQNSKSQSRRKNTKASAKAQPQERHSLWVNLGRLTIGRIEQVGKSFGATTAGDRRIKLGVFRSLRGAADAISAAHGAAR